MSNQSLTMIQEIENEAQQIQKNYELKVETYKKELESKHDQFIQKRINEDNIELNELKHKLEHEVEQAQENLKQTEEDYRQKTDAILNQDKERYIDQIIQTLMHTFTKAE